ncbi:MAG: NAD-dependent epimerase/dehydratase family protein [Chloroflexota bacterium]|nr:NAD-dependent epimerase/dehydratase family protein [Chloroflexota bacterium]
MRVIVTGGGGFIGRALIKRLAAGGVDVVALVRDPQKAAFLEQPHVTLEQSDLKDTATLADLMRGADGVIHAAGEYRVGIAKDERPKMLDANLGTTERVLDAAIAAQTQRIVYVSTVIAFGDTGGKVVDETYRRDTTTKPGRFLSFYDESKYLAHLAAERRIAQGAPIVTVQPVQVYGPHDHSAVGGQLAAAYAGQLPYLALASVGLAFVHVDDLADGIVAALIRGRIGQSYVLGGAPVRLRDALAIAAKAGRHSLPRLTLPTRGLRLIALLHRRGINLAGAPSGLTESIDAGDNVTYWASSAKAIKELGFDSRPLEQGIAATYGPAT